jgi:predicted regulator of Ras-like GTPase activity (Roadblock/LC7/MglB family)
MIFIRKDALVYVFGFLALFLIPFFFVSMPLLPTETVLFPIVALEFLLYLLYIRVSAKQRDLGPAFACSFVLLVGRWIVCLIDGLLFSLFNPDFLTSNIGAIWVGNPISALLQMFVILTVMPHLVVRFAPGILGEAERNLSLAGSSSPSGQRAAGEKTELPAATPLGGLVRLYSFQELENYFHKIIGLEGFVLYSQEGLVVWKDLQIDLDVESLVARYKNSNSGIERVTQECGLGQSMRFIVETQNHFLINIHVAKGFFLLLVFNNQLPLSDIVHRVGIMVRSIQAFLASRYLFSAVI